MKNKPSSIAKPLAAQVIQVSVIIPCRNEEDCIEASVRSIFDQDPPSGGFEVIVADGMSTDNTRGILDRLAKEDDRLIVIDNPRRFVSSGLNAAIAVSRGKVIVRKDAHTVYARDYVRQCLAVLEETGADNVGGPWAAEGEGLMGRAIATRCSPIEPISHWPAAGRFGSCSGPTSAWPRPTCSRRSSVNSGPIAVRGGRVSSSPVGKKLKWQRLRPFEKFVALIERHWAGIAAYGTPPQQGQVGLRRRPE